jgi:hypothetical protein
LSDSDEDDDDDAPVDVLEAQELASQKATTIGTSGFATHSDLPYTSSAAITTPLFNWLTKIGFTCQM